MQHRKLYILTNIFKTSSAFQTKQQVTVNLQAKDTTDLALLHVYFSNASKSLWKIIKI